MSTMKDEGEKEEEEDAAPSDQSSISSSSLSESAEEELVVEERIHAIEETEGEISTTSITTTTTSTRLQNDISSMGISFDSTSSIASAQFSTYSLGDVSSIQQKNLQIGDDASESDGSDSESSSEGEAKEEGQPQPQLDGEDQADPESLKNRPRSATPYSPASIGVTLQAQAATVGPKLNSVARNKVRGAPKQQRKPPTRAHVQQLKTMNTQQTQAAPRKPPAQRVKVNINIPMSPSPLPPRLNRPSDNSPPSGSPSPPPRPQRGGAMQQQQQQQTEAEDQQQPEQFQEEGEEMQEQSEDAEEQPKPRRVPVGGVGMPLFDPSAARDRLKKVDPPHTSPRITGSPKPIEKGPPQPKPRPVVPARSTTNRHSVGEASTLPDEAKKAITLEINGTEIVTGGAKSTEKHVLYIILVKNLEGEISKTLKLRYSVIHGLARSLKKQFGPTNVPKFGHRIHVAGVFRKKNLIIEERTTRLTRWIADLVQREHLMSSQLMNDFLK